MDKPFPSVQPSTLAGSSKPHGDKQFSERSFPIRSIDEVLSAIRRAGGTGKLEVHFRDGQARGEAKWKGFYKPDP